MQCPIYTWINYCGIESQRSSSGPCFPSSWSLLDIYDSLSLQSRTGQKKTKKKTIKSDNPQSDKKSHVTSDCCDVTPRNALPQICQPRVQTVLGLHSWVDDIIFSTLSNHSNTQHVQYNAAFCTLYFSHHYYKIFNDFKVAFPLRASCLVSIYKWMSSQIHLLP